MHVIMWAKALRPLSYYTCSFHLRRRALEVVQEKADLGTVEFNVYHDTGFELDIFHRESRLNIELDGPRHSNCLVRDDLRDEILARHKIKVVRIPLVGKSFESVAADVLRVLENTQGNPLRR